MIFFEPSAQFQAALREAIRTMTQNGLSIWESNPGRFENIAGRPFSTYLPALAVDLQTPAFEHLLSVTRQTFGAIPGDSSLDQLELARFFFFQRLQGAVPCLDWEHPRRVARIAVAMGAEIGFSTGKLLDLYWGALFHDVGKLFTETLGNQLDRQGCYLPVVLAFIRTHAALGELFMDCVTPLFPLGKICAGQHQESIDGSGYPLGLCREQISTEGRLVNLADYYDATVTRTNWSMERVRDEEVDFYRQAGYTEDAELRVFLSVIAQYHSAWYPAN